MSFLTSSLVANLLFVVTALCGSNAFQGYFDDAKESRFKQIPKIQESRFKDNQDQDSRLKIQESREDLIKISTKKSFSKH